MPEVIIPDVVKNYAVSVPTFLVPKMPKELSNEPAEAVNDEPKPVAEAATTEPVEKVQEEGKDEQETTGTDPEKASKKSSSIRFERRMDRAVRERAEANARAEAAERKALELEAKFNAPKVEGAPKMEDFTDIEEFRKAVVEHTRSETIKDHEKKLAGERSKASQEKLSRDWESKVTKGISKYDDFDEVVGDLKPTTPWGVAIMQADNGEDIAHYLGTHPKEAERIVNLDPYSQFREIGKLEAKLSAQPDAPKKPSKAPQPITPVTGAAEAGETNLTDNMPIEKYMKVGHRYFRGR